MKPEKKTPSISDKQLSQVLASLREDVAAPPEFRAKLMQRLQAEGLVKAAPAFAPAEPSLLDRIQAWLTPVRMGLAASAALALVLVARFNSPTPATVVAPEVAQGSQTAVSAQTAPASASSAQVVMAKVKPKSVQVTLPVVEVAQGPKTTSSPMPEAILDETRERGELAVGNEATSAPVTSSQVAVAPGTSSSSVPSTGAGVPLQGASSSTSASGVSAAGQDPKPTIVVVEPSPTPVINLEGHSQLRGNVIRASRGEAAVLVYRVYKPGRVRAEIYDRLGRSIAVLKDAEQPAGVYELKWGGQSDSGPLAPSGILVLDLSAPGYRIQHKLVLVK